MIAVFMRNYKIVVFGRSDNCLRIFRTWGQFILYVLRTNLLHVRLDIIVAPPRILNTAITFRLSSCCLGRNMMAICVGGRSCDCPETAVNLNTEWVHYRNVRPGDVGGGIEGSFTMSDISTRVVWLRSLLSLVTCCLTFWVTAVSSSVGTINRLSTISLSNEDRCNFLRLALLIKDI